MQDQPTPLEILESVAAFLRDVAAPRLPSREAFDARVAANALDLVRRQTALSPSVTEQDEAERQRLVQLLGVEGSLQELNQQLCSRIAAGELGLADAQLMQHLWSTTLSKLAIDQPTYASYQRVLAEHAGSR
jgi:hypothetical protein